MHTKGDQTQSDSHIGEFVISHDVMSRGREVLELVDSVAQ